ncbi:MAG: winged helix-turn-helix transcriptional regulator [Myxococcales bacterium]|nr:winged helix-turn-helix transcriptional regulator [Myxococcales bacterium]
MQRTSFADMSCSIARTLQVVGEPWTPLILRDLFVGIRRFNAIREDLGISRKVLSARLGWLEAHGMITREAYSDRPVRHEYVLTEKGLAFVEILIAMTTWGDRWERHPSGPPIRYRHHGCGEVTSPHLHCDRCGERVQAGDVSVEPTPTD